MDTDPRYLHSELTGRILEGFYRICNQIGFGFEPDVYKRALAIEIETLGLGCEINKSSKMNYKGSEIGTFQKRNLPAERKGTENILILLIFMIELIRQTLMCIGDI